MFNISKYIIYYNYHLAVTVSNIYYIYLLYLYVLLHYYCVLRLVEDGYTMSSWLAHK